MKNPSRATVEPASLDAAKKKVSISTQAESSMKSWLREQLEAYEHSKLSQGGHTNHKIPLKQVFIDLPVSDTPVGDYDDATTGWFARASLEAMPLDLAKFYSLLVKREKENEFFAEIVTTENQRLRNSKLGFAATLLVGGPGQGKSTLTQLMSQLHRAALLLPFEEEFTSTGKDLIRSYTRCGDENNDNLQVNNALFPLQVSLPDLASWISRQAHSPERNELPAILRFICDAPSAKLANLNAHTLAAYVRCLPCLLILDGFDEVGAAPDREGLVESANELLRDLAGHGVFTQIIVTTRPQGYTGEFDKLDIPLTRWHLTPLQKSDALNYANLLVKQKVPSVDLQHKILEKLSEAASAPATERLFATPLQVTILAALIEQWGRAPKERWTLFYNYFSYTYIREVERHTYASDLLHNFRSHIEEIHARVGLLLQVEAERDGATAAKMSREKLEEVIDQVLLEAGFSESERSARVREIALAAEQRLVFLVEPEPGMFGFEIRSIQEFMAAWALTNGRDSAVEERLFEISKASIYRNVLLFAASRIFGSGSHLRDIFAHRLCENLDSDARNLSAVESKAGALLALEILEEGAVLSFPKWAKELFLRAGRLFRLPAGDEHVRLASIATVETQPLIKDIVEQAIIEARRNDLPLSNGVWITVIEAANRNQDWAKQIGDENWEKLTNLNVVLNSCMSLGVSVGPWLRSKLNHTPAKVSAQAFARLKFSSSRVSTIDWPMVLHQALNFEFRASMITPATQAYGVHRKKIFTQAQLATLPPPPEAWQPWCEMALFEMVPKKERLASALRAVAKYKPNWEAEIYWMFSWPLTASLRWAENTEQLLHLADSIENGELGDITQWRRAENGWQKRSRTLDLDWRSVANAQPWSTESLATQIPVSIVNWWIYIDEMEQGTVSPIKQLQKYYTTFFSKKVRDHVAHEILRGMSITGSSFSGLGLFLGELLRDNPGLASLLISRPRYMPELLWKSILTDADPKYGHFYTMDIEGVIDSIQKYGPKSLLINALVSRVTTKRASKMEPLHLNKLARIVDSDEFKLVDDPQRLIIKLFARKLSVAEDDALVSSVLGADRDRERYVGILLKLVNSRQLNRARQAYVASGILRGLEINSRHASSAVETLRQIFQMQTSDVGDAANWEKLALPLPRPERNTVPKQRVLRQVPLWLSKIELSDIKGIEKLSMNLTLPKEKESGQWIVILGPNGSGKTSLLKALCLSLRNVSDPTIWPSHSLSSPWLRILGDDQTVNEAKITITDAERNICSTTIHATGSFPFTQNLTKEYESTHQWVFAYGCRRSSALGGNRREVDLSSRDGLAVASLFDETADLVHAESWLINFYASAIADPEKMIALTDILGALKKILDVDKVSVNGGKVFVKEHDKPLLPIGLLSDGYLTSTGWFIDLLARWIEQYTQYGRTLPPKFLDVMTGLVLIDEIDLHLHPKWQIEIIGRTKSILPKMSFVVTTHNPLTLVGARADEIWMLQRDGSSVKATQGIENPVLLTGGQIYLRYFGIEDVFPNGFGEKVQRFMFLARFALRSKEEDDELHDLAKKLDAVGLRPEWEIVPRKNYD